MSFRAWLYAQSVPDDVISEEDYCVDDLTEDAILTQTDLYEDDLESYRNDFREHCESEDMEPDWDLPEV